MRTVVLLAATAFLVVPVLRPASAAPPAPGPEPVPRWRVADLELEAEREAGPETEVTLTFRGPGSARHEVRAFRSTATTWRARFRPPAEGTWSWRSSAEPEVPGLDGREGSLRAGPPVEDGHRFDEHGPVQVSADGRRLAHADGTPFLFISDTAWNGALLSSEEGWERYLEDRAAKGFTAVQFVVTQWRAAYENAEGRVAWTGRDDIEIHPEFFERIDRRIAAVNAKGLLAVPVMLWGLGDPEYTPGRLPTDQAIRLARHIRARWHAHHVLWFLGGDEDYGGERTRHWKAIGRAVFGDRPHAPVTLHPRGMQWKFDPFLEEEWLDLLIYQSGHGDDARTLRWIHSGPPAKAWKRGPPRPVINAEPPYEAHIAYQSRKPHTAFTVRRAIWWSLLVAPTAGTSYGAHGVWSWQKEAGVPLNHGGTGEARPWQEAIELPGSDDVGHIASFFAEIPWWSLSPAPGVLVEQPGKDDPRRWIAAARSDTGDALIAYLPVGGEVRLRPGAVPDGARAQWFDPREGERRAAPARKPGRFHAPDDRDWALIIVR